MILDRDALGAMLLQAAKLLEENTQYLSDIDSRFGDGDHGITMGKIAKLIQERVPSGARIPSRTSWTVWEWQSWRSKAALPDRCTAP